MYASMKGLQVTGNNISNINTKGYTRQVLDQVSLRTGGNDRYQSMYDVNVGSGAMCVGVSQIRDPYLDIRFRNEQSMVGALDAKMAGLNDLKALFDEVGRGADEGGILEAQFNDLVTQLTNLKVNAGGKQYDTLVRSAAESISKLFNSYAEKLETITNNTVKDFKQDVKDVNGLLTSIRDLNSSIRKSEIHGDPALELRDERNNLIDELSYYIKIDVTTEQENMGGGQYIERLVIKMAGTGQNNDTENSTLVYGQYATQLELPEKVPQLNPAYNEANPDTVGKGQYLKPDGNSTNNIDEAEQIEDPINPPNMIPNPNPDYDADDPDTVGKGKYLTADGGSTNDIDEANLVPNSNYDLSLEALKDSKKRVLETSSTTNVDNTTFNSETDADDALIAGGYENKVTTVGGKTTTVTYAVKEKTVTYQEPDPDTGEPIDKQKSVWYIARTTTETSTATDLADNDLYGALQATREMLTEAGEFTDKLVIEGNGTGLDPVDKNAASKRGIPYYQRSLDALAQKFAEIFNTANNGYMTNTDGNYVDANGKEVLIKVSTTATPSVDVEMPMSKNAPVWSDALLTAAGVDKDTDGSWKTNADGAYVDEDDNAVQITINGDLVTLTKDFTWSPQQVEAQGAQAYEKGGNLFSTSSDSNDTTGGITAKNISISKDWYSGAVQVVASTQVAIPGVEQSEANDNILHLLSQLMSNKQEYRASDVVGNAFEGDTVYFKGTLQEMLANISVTLADDTRITGSLLDTYVAAATEINTSRDSVSSVDLNDEAASMMMYQKTYAAACRMMTTIDEVLDKLINGTGVVGR